MTDETITESTNLDDVMDRCMMQGFRMEMIMPSDAPREVLMSKGIDRIRIISKNRQRASNVEWGTGRAGMLYRDLVPGRLGGKLIASHIRIVNGGEVADQVHYHKIDFQIIYCLKGAIRVVYEDQGEPFWLRPGDCVLQPPEIRHRVLEAETGSEVIEVTSPAEHETWFDHELELPTGNLRPDRVFGTQRFVRHLDAVAVWEPLDDGKTLAARTEIASSDEGRLEVYTLQVNGGEEDLIECAETAGISLKLMVGGRGIGITYK